MWTRAVEDRRKNLAPRRSLRRAAGQHLKIDARTASAGEFAPGADEGKKSTGRQSSRRRCDYHSLSDSSKTPSVPLSSGSRSIGVGVESVSTMLSPADTPKRTEAQILRSLLENGVAKRFDLRAWSDKGCAQATGMERLEVLLEQVRPDVAKLIVLEELEVRRSSFARATFSFRATDAHVSFGVCPPPSPPLSASLHVPLTLPQGTPEEDADALVYGEIALRDFAELLNAYGGTDALGGGGGVGGGRVFWDLGCGTGKGVLAAGLCSHFAFARGVELLPCTAAIASILVEDFVRDVLPGARPASAPLLGVGTHAGDMFAPECLGEWRCADFAFCNCVTWDEETMRQLSLAAEGLRPGAVFVTVLCPLQSLKFELVEEVEINFSWGAVECLVHRRMTDEQAAAAAALGDAFGETGTGDAEMVAEERLGEETR
jgi:hypothetical protein